MATLFVDKIDPQSGTTLSLGSSGDTVALTSGVVQSNLNYPAFLANASSNTSVANNSLTKLTLDDLQFDTNSAWDATNYRFTVPSGGAGKYFFRGSGRINTLGNGKVFALEFQKNGTSILQGKVIQTMGVQENIAHGINTIQDMSVGDYIEIFIYQNNGTTLTANSLYASLGGYRIGS